jgi:RimJ/RimL family protein N-acetyltransferase
LERGFGLPLHRWRRTPIFVDEAETGLELALDMVFSPPLIGLDQVWGMLVAEVALRRIDDSDLDALFEQMRDPESVRMAAFTAADPDDRTAFDVHMAKIRTSPEVTTRAVMLDGQLVGSIASFVIEGETEVTYWIDRSF